MADGLAPELPPPSPVLVSMGISLRTSAAADAPLMRALYRETRVGELARVPWSQAMRERFLDDQFRLQSLHFERNYGDGDFLVVARSAAPFAPTDVGRLYVERRRPNWHLIDITIAAAHRGQGIGSALVHWLQEGARDAGAQALTLHVAHDNPAASALYHRLGFAAVESGATHRRMRWTVS